MARKILMRNTRLIRYVLSYVALVSFALTAASFLVENTLMTQLRRQQIERFEQICNQQAATFQTWLNEMRAMKEQLEAEPLLLTSFRKMSSTEYRDIVRALSGLTGSHSYLESIHLYPGPDDAIPYIFSNIGTLVPKGTIENRAYLSPALLPQIPDLGLLLSDRPPLDLSFVFALRSGAVLRFILRHESLERILLQGLPETAGLQIYAADGSILVRTDSARPMALEVVRQAANSWLQALNQGAYWIAYTYDDADLFGPVYNVRARMARYSALLFCTGIALALTLAYQQYRPLRLLADVVRDREPNCPLGDELALVRSFMNDMIDQTQAVQLPMIERQLNALRYHLLPPEEFAMLGARLDQWLGEPATAYRMLLFTTLEARQEQSALLAQGFSLPGPQRGIVLDSLFPEWIACMVFGRPEDDRYLLERIYQAQQQCEKRWGLRPTAAVSNVFFDVRAIGKALAQTQTALESRTPDEAQSVLFYDEMMIDTSSARFRYPQELEQLLLRAVEQGEESTARSALAQLADVLYRGNQPLRVVRFQCQGLQHSLLRTLSSPPFEPPAEHLELLASAAFLPREAFQERMEAICRTACAQACAQRGQREPDLIRRAHDHVQAHLLDSQLSLESIASALGVSVSHLVKQYKLATDSSLMHEVQRRRMAWLKEQLRTTDEPIHLLISSCGQTHPSSMIRKFREQEGVTPSAYRKLYRNAVG